MARSSQRVRVRGITVIRTNNNSSRTRTTRNSNGRRRGNPNRCPACGRFM